MLENVMANADNQFGTGKPRQTINGRWTIGQMVEKQRQLHQQMISQQQQQQVIKEKVRIIANESRSLPPPPSLDTLSLPP